MKSKITVLFDAGPLVNGPRSGVGKLTQGLIEALAQAYPENLELVGHYFDFLGRKKIALPAAPNIRYRRTVVLPGKVFNMLRRLDVWIPFELFTKERGDFHFFPGFVGWPSLFKTPSAPFIHDITYLDFPELVNGPARYDLERLVPKTVRRASFIVTNSKSSEDGMRGAYQLGDMPIIVAHIPPVDAVSVSVKQADEIITGLGIVDSYILFFGTIEPRKNLVRLLSAYEQLPDELKQSKALVLAGGKGWHDAEILASLDRLRSSDCRIYQTGYVSDLERAALFQNAAVFVLPSVYEGFGMPLLEAMVYKTPMLVSDIAAHREVAVDSALYCDPLDVQDICNKLQKLLADTSLQKSLVSKGSERLKAFSWQSVTEDIYTNIVKALEDA